MSDKKDIVERLESKFIQEVAATLEEVSSCLDNYADVDDGDEGQPEANAALRQKCAVDEILGRFPKDRDETFRIGDVALHEFIPDTCSHGVIEWNPPIGQGYAAWVGESGVHHRHSHPTNPLVALAGAIIKHRDATITTLRAEVERLKKLEPVTLPATCDGIEQDAFEAWAKNERYDMAKHPLHWLFLDTRTYHARQGWKAGLLHTAARCKDLVRTEKARAEKLEAALKPFAEHDDFHASDDWAVTQIDDGSPDLIPGVTAGDFKRAKAAIASLTD